MEQRRFIINFIREKGLVEMGGCMKPTDKQKNTQELKKMPEETTADELSVQRNRSFTLPRPDQPYFDPSQKHYLVQPIHKKPTSHREQRPKIQSICPLGHPLNHTQIVYKQLTSCNKCHTKYNYKQNIKSFSLFYRCTDCKYLICCKCLQFKHEDICQAPSLSYCRTNKYKIVGYSKTGSIIKCCFCAKRINNFIHCETCKAGACGACVGLKKHFKCEHKFEFNQRQNMMCVYCQKFGEGFIECKKCNIQMCPPCYTAVYLKQ